MSARKLDAIYGAAIVVAALLVFWFGVVGVKHARSVASDPFWYPEILLGLIAACGAFMTARALYGVAAGGPPSVRWVRLYVCVVLSVAYMLAYYRAGFVCDTLAFIPVMGWCLGYRRPLVLALVAVGFTVTVWYAFHFVLHITPPGPGLPTLGY